MDGFDIGNYDGGSLCNSAPGDSGQHDPVPVATSVSAPTEAELEKQWIADGSTNSFKTWLIWKLQGASSSSAALQKEVEHQKANYNELKCEAKRKVAELTEQVKEWRQITANRDKSMVEQRGELSKAKTERDELRDSRDRLQEALRDVEHCWTVFYSRLRDGEYHGLGEMRSAIRVARAVLGDPPDRGVLSK